MALAAAAHGDEIVRVGVATTVETYVNIRSEPTADSAVIGELRRGETAPLLDELNYWFAVALPDGQTGYVYRQWMEKLQPGDLGATGASQPAADAAASIRPNDDVTTFVNIRAQARIDSAVIGRLRAGKTVRLIDETGQWYVVGLSDGLTGYVSRDWARPVDAAATAPVGVAEQPAIATAGAPSDPGAEPARSRLAVALPGSADLSTDRDRSALVPPTRLLEQGDSGQAYEMLRQLEVEWGGDAGFDYLYGIAALESGRAGEAIFSLERVIRSLPEFVGARLDLARALFETGDRERAQHEFNAILEADPPEDVRGIVQGYLNALTPPKPEREPPSRVLYAAATGGYDSNANGAADLNDFLGFTLNPRSTEQDTPFAEARFGGYGRRPLNAPVDLLWRADAKHRHNPDADFVDHTFFNATAALGFSRGKNDFITGVSAYWSALDSQFNERSAALDLIWLRPLGNNTKRETVRNGPVRFGRAQQTRDVERLLYTLTLRQPIQDGGGTLDWSLVAGRDDAEADTSPYSNRRFGGRIGARWQLAAYNLAFNIGKLGIPYSGSGFFGIDRDDDQFTATFAIEVPNWPRPGWSFVPNIRYANNDSNVPIFDYDRIEIGASFRVAR